jgi:hypothetical protein
MFRNMQWATPEERRALGQARRKQVGRHQHEVLQPKLRPVPALALVERSMRGRVPALIALKYELMAESPFGYFRGAAPVMAADLAQLPSTGIMSQLCGDAHVRNLGAYAAPDGRLAFDINDFDETILGPFEWDLKRMAASLVLAGRAAGHKDGSARKAAVACVERYAAQMRAFSRMPQLEVNRFQVHRLGLAKAVHMALGKAERATPQHTLDQLTAPASTRPGVPRHFKESKPMLTRVTGARAAAVLASLGPYREMLEPQRRHLLSFYRPVDVAFKVVGTGSVGLRDYCIYFEGNGPVSARRASCAAQRATRGRRTTRHADPDRSVSGLDAHGRAAISGAPTERSQGIDRDRRPGGREPESLRRGVRRAAGARSRTLRRSAGDCRLRGVGHRLR